jgi:DNA-binding NtrC family response regulator
MTAPEPGTTVRNLHPGSEGPTRLFLLVLRGGRFEAHPLPASGDVVIGRSERCDVRVEDPSISRTHAVVHVGPPLAIEDLGSVNGTRVRDTPLETGKPVPIAYNEVIALGSVMIIIQQRSTPIRPQRIWSHDYFEGRLAEECARGERFRPSFAVLRLDCDEPVPPSTIRDAFAESLRTVDVAASYGPREYEVLLSDAGVGDAEPVTIRLTTFLAERGVRARTGIAYYPRDGRDPDSLIARAAAVARGEVEDGAGEFIVHDPAMQHLYRLAERVAAGDISVLIIGETGVGKEVLADWIHRTSRRSQKPFLRLNCAALTESLLESELFGHEKGAFTGAMASKQGLLETADGGTVFLDEIGELSPSAQVKLLRVLEERMVMRVGGLKPRTVDVRFVCATNRDLEEEVAREAFREDLFYRVAGVTLAIPPLRHRTTEIVPLAQAFLEQSCKRLGRSDVPALTPEAKQLLVRYSWPGNIRELRNVMERASLLSIDGEVRPEHLPVEKITGTYTTRAKRPTQPPRGERGLDTMPPPADGGDAGPPLEPGERERVLRALNDCGGNQTEAAKVLGMSRRTLAKRLEAFGIPRPRKARQV